MGDSHCEHKHVYEQCSSEMNSESLGITFIWAANLTCQFCADIINMSCMKAITKKTLIYKSTFCKAKTKAI